MILKTTNRNLRALEKLILKNHPYDTAEFVALSPTAATPARQGAPAAVCATRSRRAPLRRGGRRSTGRIKVCEEVYCRSNQLQCQLGGEDGRRETIMRSPPSSASASSRLPWLLALALRCLLPAILAFGTRQGCLAGARIDFCSTACGTSGTVAPIWHPRSQPSRHGIEFICCRDVEMEYQFC